MLCFAVRFLLSIGAKQEGARRPSLSIGLSPDKLLDGVVRELVGKISGASRDICIISRFAFVRMLLVYVILAVIDAN